MVKMIKTSLQMLGIALLSSIMMPLFSTEKPNINHLVFFGDSLTDNGNLYHYDFSLLPKSPPYYDGRFSNGYTWADNLTLDFYHLHYIAGENYAVGGATTILHNPFNGFLPYDMAEEIDTYLFQHLFTSKKNTLFLLWIGGNDYLPGNTDVNGITDQVVQETMKDIDKLANAGGENFIVLNLPDLGKTPAALENNKVDNLHQLTLEHNKKLNIALHDYQTSHPNIHLITNDIYELFDNLITHPETYNTRYGIHLQNFSTACWQGGYALTRSAAPQQMVMQELSWENTSLKSPLTPTALNAFAAQVTRSPALSEALQTQNLYMSGAMPCQAADQYVFWDHIHPTATMHYLLAQVVEEQVLQFFNVMAP